MVKTVVTTPAKTTTITIISINNVIIDNEAVRNRNSGRYYVEMYGSADTERHRIIRAEACAPMRIEYESDNASAPHISLMLCSF